MRFIPTKKSDVLFALCSDDVVLEGWLALVGLLLGDEAYPRAQGRERDLRNVVRVSKDMPTNGTRPKYKFVSDPDSDSQRFWLIYVHPTREECTIDTKKQEGQLDLIILRSHQLIYT